MPLPHQDFSYTAHDKRSLEYQESFSSSDDSSLSDLSMDTALLKEQECPKDPSSFFDDNMLVVQTKHKDMSEKDKNQLSFRDIDGSEFLVGDHGNDFRMKDFDMCKSPNPFLDSLGLNAREDTKEGQKTDSIDQNEHLAKKDKTHRRRKKKKKEKRESTSTADRIGDTDPPVTLEVQKHRKKMVVKQEQPTQDLADDLAQHLGAGLRSMRQTRRPGREAQEETSDSTARKGSLSSPPREGLNNTSYKPRRSSSLASEPPRGDTPKRFETKASPPNRRAAMARQKSASSLTMSGNRVDIMIMPMVEPSSVDRRAKLARTKSVPALQTSAQGRSSRKLLDIPDRPPVKPVHNRNPTSTNAAPSRRRGLLRSMSERGGFSASRPSNLRSGSAMIMTSTPEDLLESPDGVGSSAPMYASSRNLSALGAAPSRRRGLLRSASERGGFSVTKPSRLRSSSDVIKQGKLEELVESPTHSVGSSTPTNVADLKVQQPQPPPARPPPGRRAALRRAKSERGTLGHQLTHFDVVETPKKELKLSLSEQRRTIFR